MRADMSAQGDAARFPDPPLIYAAVDLSRVAPGPRLVAEDTAPFIGLLVGLPISLALWALIWTLVAG